MTCRVGTVVGSAFKALSLALLLVAPAVADRPSWREIDVMGISLDDHTSTFARRLSYPRVRTIVGLREWSFRDEALRVRIDMGNSVVLLVGHQLECVGHSFQAPAQNWLGNTGSPLSDIEKVLGKPDQFVALGPDGCLYYAFAAYDWPEARLVVGLTHPDSGEEIRATNFWFEKRDPVDCWQSPMSPNGRFWLRVVSQKSKDSENWLLGSTILRTADGYEVLRSVEPYELRKFTWTGPEEVELALSLRGDARTTKMKVQLGEGTFMDPSDTVYPLSELEAYLSETQGSNLPR